MLRVVITGPESCGKTTLIKGLAEHFHVGFVSEYAREYLEKKLNKQNKAENLSIKELYNQNDLTEIYRGQIRNEGQTVEKIFMRNSIHLMLCDTDVLTLKIWAEEVFKSIDEAFLSHIVYHIKAMNDTKMVSTIYILCSPEGIEWQPDPLRENPNDRDRLFDIYQKNLVHYKQSYFILRGSKEKRLAEAIKIIKRQCKIL